MISDGVRRTFFPLRLGTRGWLGSNMRATPKIVHLCLSTDLHNRWLVVDA
jgi:hypothetical protein